MATAFPDECNISTPQDHEYELKEESGRPLYVLFYYSLYLLS